MIGSVFTITDIHSFYIFKALLQQIRQSFEEKSVLLTTFMLKMRVLTFLIFGNTRYRWLFCLHYSTWLKKVTLKDTIKEDANRKQSHHKERCPGKHNITLTKKEHPSLFFSNKTRCLLFWHLRQLQHCKRYCPKEGLWLWSQQHLDMPVACHKWLLQMERGEN